MGSSQSTRRLTILNEEEAGVIKVSNSLIQRLANANTESSTSVEPTTEVRPSPQAQQSKPASVQPPLPSPPLSDAAGQPVYYCTDLTLSALQIQQQKAQEIKQLDEHWQKRLSSLQKDYSVVGNIMEEEYQKALKEYQSGKQTVNTGRGKLPCQENSKKVLQCYQTHTNEVLKCSAVVEEFSKCVDQCRANVIATRC